MRINTGGQAFPLPVGYNPGNNDFLYGNEFGMTLRQWYAGHFAAAIIAANRTNFMTTIEVKAIPQPAFDLADAMIKFEKEEALREEKNARRRERRKDGPITDGDDDE